MKKSQFKQAPGACVGPFFRPRQLDEMSQGAQKCRKVNLNKLLEPVSSRFLDPVYLIGRPFGSCGRPIAVQNDAKLRLPLSRIKGRRHARSV